MGYDGWHGAQMRRDSVSKCRRNTPRRMDLGVIWRIARCIADDREIRRTSLAARCRMKYTSCMSYLDIMMALGMVTVHKRIGLTDHGYRVLERITP